MTSDEIKAHQKLERRQLLTRILEDSSRKKLIVAGAGTGKTFIFREVLKQKANGKNLALTFIRKLVDEIHPMLQEYAEVKTFHAYCKKILHEIYGTVDLASYLTNVIEKDAALLGLDLKDFDTKIQNLEGSSPEIDFYLHRGNFYKVISFNDSVYRLYRILQERQDVLPTFDQIVIDEFQDFNPLEVAFIAALEKKGPVLIVGDDDQAVYDGRSASPDHLRAKYRSGEYTKLDLPFCSRCPEVIVNATNSFIQRACALGHLRGRIAKRYECYLEDKEKDSLKYPKIRVAECTVPSVVAKYIANAVAQIDPADIAESYQKGQEYPTVLVAGQRHYLGKIAEVLKKTYPQVTYSPSQNWATE